MSEEELGMYVFYWKDGTINQVEAAPSVSPEEALAKTGRDDVKALDHWDWFDPGEDAY